MKLPSFEAGHDRGETSVQAVLLVPVVLGLFFLATHAAVLAHGSHVANLVATRGAQLSATGTVLGFQKTAALNEMEQVVIDLGSHMSQPPIIYLGESMVVVSVTIDVQKIVPFLPSTVTRTARMSREQFIREQDR
jgi:hypothetical protein